MKLQKLLAGRAAALAAIVCCLQACGGGGGGDAAPAPAAGTPPPEVAKGTVGLLFTDAPSDEFAKINVTITGAVLIGGEAQVTLFSGLQTLNLLDLENFTELFVVADEVPAGEYSKIRLELASVELVREDEDGNVIEVIEPRLPGNGKLDLNPRGGFSVTPQATVLIQVDWDVDKSIHIVERGNGEWNFRPVLFVDVIVENGQPDKLSRVAGTIVESDMAADRYVVCPADSIEEEEDDAREDCIVVHVREDTGIFDANGEPTDELALIVGEQVTAIGTLSHGEDELDDDIELWLVAAVIELGPPGTFSAFSGTVLTEPDDADQFRLALAAGQGFAMGSEVAVALKPGTRVFDTGGNPLGVADIAVDQTAEIEGVMLLSDETADLLRAALIVLDIDPAQDLDRLSGTILSVDSEAGNLMLATDEGDRCVSASADLEVFVITVSDDLADSAMVGLDALAPGMSADMYGAFAIDGCFAAETIIGFAQGSDGG